MCGLAGWLRFSFCLHCWTGLLLGYLPVGGVSGCGVVDCGATEKESFPLLESVEWFALRGVRYLRDRLPCRNRFVRGFIGPV